MLRKMGRRILFEIRMFIMDVRWHNKWFHCWESYPPSFYYRYTLEEQQNIIDRDFEEIRKMLEEFKNTKGIR